MIELTVIGGYLGAGKTTLLNEILDRTDGERVAVIVNDFGTVNIDAEIISSDDGRTWDIANGCICCDLSDGMAAAIESIRTTSPPVSRIFVEVSGVGQPEVVARWGDHPGFVRGGALVCADATSIRRDVNRKWVGETVLSQLRGADRILLTKTDLVDGQQRREVLNWLAAHPGIDAEIINRDDVLAGGQVERSETATPSADDAVAEPVPSVDDGTASRAPARVHSSWSITATSAIDPEQLCNLIFDLPETVVRAKGILPDSRKSGRRFLVQYDGKRCKTSELESDGETVTEGSTVADGGVARESTASDGVTVSDGVGRLVIIAAGDHAGTPEAVASLAQALHGWVGD
ncbi:GTP-binding protein [Brevibacterium marinum]|uniref:G3E family GTPase n=1 Tax=Brevibacterium marinum TaxID=418643 RepID=A0A846S1V3_9MICO|nr:GTP-binding protein [Brevibacterium marinum]NJC57028.1 G3E family GTPase [Brevibacterium marinum]